MDGKSVHPVDDLPKVIQRVGVIFKWIVILNKFIRGGRKRGKSPIQLGNTDSCDRWIRITV